MPARMRRSALARGSALPRKTTWARGSGGVPFAAPGFATFDLLSDFKAAGGVTQGVTVVRTHLYLSFSTLPSAGDVFGVGILRGQNTDIGNNIAGAPKPIDDEFEDWAYWEAPIASDAGGGVGPSYYPWNILRLDLKAQRKIPELQMTYTLVLQSTNGSDIVNWSASTLLKLP